ncbi:PASTA domain-containing protein [candidate division WOR-3 bacterium]|nr:PASTA domain-containing protein [candidate division WOR-3 bacterium]
MYYQQSSAKVFWIAFLTSLIVSSLVAFTFVYFVPQVLSGKSKMVEIPDVENLELHKAEMIMDEKGLKIITEDEKFHPTTKKGRVIYQKPTAGEIAERGSTVRVVLSKGSEERVEGGEEIVVPSVVGFDINQAKVYLSERGLSVGVVERQESEEAKDVVIKTVPEPGQKVTEAVPIKLIVSSGGGKVSVPNLRGKSEYRARLLLEESGLELGSKNYTTSGEHAFDIVISQSPQPGVMIERGSKVDITINREGR